MVCSWNFHDGRPASNFDTFVVALLTVFQVSLPFAASFKMWTWLFSI